jgi:hypothetical protein
MAEHDSPTDGDTYSPKAALLGLAIVLVLVFVCLFLYYTLRDMSQRQDCLMQGRSNCDPIEAPTSRSQHESSNRASEV